MLAASLFGHLLAGMSVFLPAPRAADGGGYRALYALCNAAALNFGEARNAARLEPKAPRS